MTKIKMLLIHLLITIPFIGFTQEFAKHNIDSLSKHLHSNYKILEIHIRKKSQIKKYTKENIKQKNKYYRQKKILWIPEKPGKAIETYIIKVLDSTNYSYFIVSKKMKTNSEEKLIIGNTYLIELNRIRYMGEIHGPHFKNLDIDGTYILLPREAWSLDIYISPNLQGLYYVR